MKTNEKLQKDVVHELAWEPRLDAGKIGIAAEDGVITLTGHCSSYAEKIAAEKAAKRVAGVRGVANDVVVRISGSNVHDDTEIAQAALDALSWNTPVPDGAVKVIVKEGWITLEGETHFQFQRKASESAVRYLSGVKGVNNMITLKPRATATGVKEMIEDALKRSAEVDSQQIRVECTAGKVILHGTARSWAELDEVEEAAWAAPGVTSVQSELVVADPVGVLI